MTIPIPINSTYVRVCLLPPAQVFRSILGAAQQLGEDFVVPLQWPSGPSAFSFPESRLMSLGSKLEPGGEVSLGCG
jgi:hypothetical protein